jgi:hypothetical protein
MSFQFIIHFHQVIQHNFVNYFKALLEIHYVTSAFWSLVPKMNVHTIFLYHQSHDHYVIEYNRTCPMSAATQEIDSVPFPRLIGARKVNTGHI